MLNKNLSKSEINMSTFRQKISVYEQIFLVFIYFLDVIISTKHSNYKNKFFIVV